MPVKQFENFALGRSEIRAQGMPVILPPIEQQQQSRLHLSTEKTPPWTGDPLGAGTRNSNNASTFRDNLLLKAGKYKTGNIIK